MRLLCNLQGIEVGRMAPTEAMRGVFLWCVLGILDEEISITRQGHVMRRLREVLRCRSVTKGFIVCGIRQDCAVDSEAVSQGTSGVIDHAGFNGDTVREFDHAPFSKLNKFDLGSHGVHRNRKVRTPHLARDDLFERQPSMRGAQDRQLRASDIGWGKKGDPLNVIPMGMAQEQVRAHRTWVGQQRLT